MVHLKVIQKPSIQHAFNELWYCTMKHTNYQRRHAGFGAGVTGRGVGSGLEGGGVGTDGAGVGAGVGSGALAEGGEVGAGGEGLTTGVGLGVDGGAGFEPPDGLNCLIASTLAQPTQVKSSAFSMPGPPCNTIVFPLSK